MVIALVLFTVFKQFDGRAPTADTVTYTQFMNDAQAGRISKVDIQGDTMYVTPDAGRPYSLRSEEHTSELQSLMRISYAVFCLKKKTIGAMSITPTSSTKSSS